MKPHKTLITITSILCILCAQPARSANLPEIHGFAEVAAGAVVSDTDGLTKHAGYNLMEERLQLKTRYAFDGNDILARWNSSLTVKGDLTLDNYFGSKTGGELRELVWALSPASFMDVKLGRQILTWGTGDYVFINDLFPKDYISFYAGRNDEYLKKPSDALRVSLYPAWANIDFVMIGHFTPNTIPDGDRLSFFDSFQQGIAGRASDRDLLEPAVQPENAQYALRLYKTIGSNEAALYYFRGFDPMPRSYKDQAARQLYYERLDSYGTSLRGPFMSGIGNIELGYYRSRDDSDGIDRLVENSMFKALTGYEKDFGGDLKVGVQYLYEQRLEYANYMNNLISGDYFWDECHHLVTQRITKLYKNQTVRVTLFNFYSPSDHDGYVRFSTEYDITDQWKITAGTNIPWGEDDLTDFGQMKKNKNIFLRVRYTF